MSAESRSEVREKEFVIQGPRSAVENPVLPPGSPTRAPEEKRRSLWWVWLVLLAAAGYGVYRWYPNLTAGQSQGKSGKGGGASAAATRAVPVVAVTSRHGDMPVYINGLGTVTA